MKGRDGKGKGLREEERREGKGKENKGKGSTLAGFSRVGPGERVRESGQRKR